MRAVFSLVRTYSGYKSIMRLGKRGMSSIQPEPDQAAMRSDFQCEGMSKIE